MTTIRWTLAAVAALTLGAAGAATAAPKAPARSCESLAGLSIPASMIRLPTRGAVIDAARAMPAVGAAGTPDYLPDHCEVRGKIVSVDAKAPNILFGVDLPAQWNGHAIQIGGNGANGFIPFLAALNRGGAGSPAGPTFPPNAPYPLGKGYVTYGDDSGHVANGGRPPGFAGGQPPATPLGPPPVGDNSWMANNEAWKNFAYENVRKDHDAVMSIVALYYGARPGKTYFMGESQGGRQSLAAITRYGDDYDGVLVSVPLSYNTGIVLSPAIRLQAQREPGAWVPPTKREAIQREVIRQCDALDGIKDGVINNYIACDNRFDPTIAKSNPLAALRCAGGADTGVDCLSDKQIAVVNSFHAPIKFGYPLANGETSWPGEPAGGEWTQNWMTSNTDPSKPAPAAGPGQLARVFHDDSITPETLDLKLHRKQIQATSADLDSPVNWGPFLAKGGKVIFHTASNDYVTNSRNHAQYYHAVVKTVGKAAFDRNARFYVTPGGDHGSKSFTFPDKAPIPGQMDLVGALENWVENGVAPAKQLTQVVMETKAPYAITWSRPLCSYPAYPRYRGKGDPKAAESYVCAAN